MRVEHRTCSDRSSQAAVIAKARADARRDAGLPPEHTANGAGVRPRVVGPAHRPAGGSWRPPTSSGSPDPSLLCPRDLEVPAIPWDDLTNGPWLRRFATIPFDASPPRAMSPPHPDATGSYGEAAEAWVRAELGIVLRWWQALALTRLLEHDADGRLVWATAISSTPRRAGKSRLLLALAAWRIAHGDALGEIPQTVVHVSLDRSSVMEVLRLSWPWAIGNGFTVRKASGLESIELPDGSRWLLKSDKAVYGLEVGLGVVDEAWSVDAEVVDDGLEPATIHRTCPQIVLTSTAHRRATSLMRRRLAAAVAGYGDDWSTLVLWWAAPGGAAIGDPATWRAASPHWTDQQARLIADRWGRVQRGEADPQADDLDPLEGFKAQYLNLWPPVDAAAGRREAPAIPADLWSSALSADGTPTGRPVAAAIEGWFAAGISVAFAWIDDHGRAVVSAESAPTLSDAVDRVRSAGPPVVLVGKSLAADAALTALASAVTVEPVGDSTLGVVTELRRLVDENRVRHDGSAVLTDQVSGLTVVDSTTGPRLRPGAVVSAVKAATWAARRALAATEPPAIF